ncbi:MAG: peroxiredoxin [Spirochaetia bacterium]|nr:peroxiredoxin [Spirochaetia bacterium]
MPRRPSSPSKPDLFATVLRVGDRAPNFILPTAGGKPFQLKDRLGKKILVLYFYPHDFSANCAREARAFRAHYVAFKNLGAEIFGISRDSQKSHRDFIRAESLPFNLLSDPEGKVHRRYGVEKLLGFLPRRTTFVIDSKGVILFKYSSLLRPASHSQKSALALKGFVKKKSRK